MDNFDEQDDKLMIEISLASEVLNDANSFLFNNPKNEAIENLFQNDNTKLVLNSKNPYSKLAFIKALKDNLLCLGYLEETIDTLSYFQEDMMANTITSITNNVAPKKRKVLSRKRSHDKSNFVGSSELFEVNLKY